MATELYLVRHGETVDNKAQIMQGQTQGRLNETGVSQALALRDKLRGVPFDAYVSSDLRRAYDTCAIIAGPTGKDVVTTALLRERDWGDFTGRYIPDLRNIPMPGNVESMERLKARARQFIEYIAGTFADKRVLAVGHGIINKAIQSVALGKPMSEIAPMRNTEVRILTFGPC